MVNIKQIGVMLPGQRWVQLEGQFTPEELRKIAREIIKLNKDVPIRKVADDNKK